MKRHRYLEALGAHGTAWKMECVEPCSYVSEGDRVLVNFGDGFNPKVYRGIVVCAAGHHARVKAGNVERWVNVADCARPRSTE